MKINELIIIEQNQVNELNLAGVGNALKAGASALGRGAQSVSNVVQKGAANAAQNIPAITNYAGQLAKKVQPGLSNVATATGDLAKNVGTGLKGVGQGIGSVGQGIGAGLRGVGDVASSAVGAVTSPLGALAGGLKRGYDTARAGQSFSTAGGGAGAPAISHAGSSNDQEVDQLKAAIQAMDQRLRNKGI
jgi:hypothetical protein